MPTKAPQPLPWLRYVTNEDFEVFAWAAFGSIVAIEGWAGEEHPSANCGDTYTPNRHFLAEMRRQLRKLNFKVEPAINS